MQSVQQSERGRRGGGVGANGPPCRRGRNKQTSQWQTGVLVPCASRNVAEDAAQGVVGVRFGTDDGEGLGQEAGEERRQDRREANTSSAYRPRQLLVGDAVPCLGLLCLDRCQKQRRRLVRSAGDFACCPANCMLLLMRQEPAPPRGGVDDDAIAHDAKEASAQAAVELDSPAAKNRIKEVGGGGGDGCDDCRQHSERHAFGADRGGVLIAEHGCSFFGGDLRDRFRLRALVALQKRKSCRRGSRAFGGHALRDRCDVCIEICRRDLLRRSLRPGRALLRCDRGAPALEMSSEVRKEVDRGDVEGRPLHGAVLRATTQPLGRDARGRSRPAARAVRRRSLATGRR